MIRPECGAEPSFLALVKVQLPVRQFNQLAADYLRYFLDEGGVRGAGG